jgi:hypothetical protein
MTAGVSEEITLSGQYASVQWKLMVTADNCDVGKRRRSPQLPQAEGLAFDSSFELLPADIAHRSSQIVFRRSHVVLLVLLSS